MTLQADPAQKKAALSKAALSEPAHSSIAAARPDRVAYRKPQPWGMAPDLVIPNAHSDDERLWAPVAPDIWSRPLHLNVSGGHYTHLLRVRRSGVLQRHRHSGAVHAYVIRGRWHYLEHDWVAETGSFVYEPPGEIHTLTVPDDCAEMITFFNISGAMIYVDERGDAVGYEDVWTKIEMCRRHYADIGLGASYVDRYVR